MDILAYLDYYAFKEDIIEEWDCPIHFLEFNSTEIKAEQTDHQIVYIASLLLLFYTMKELRQ